MQIDEFTEKIVPLSGRLFRFAGCLLKDREDARDVVQDVLLTLREVPGRRRRSKLRLSGVFRKGLHELYPFVFRRIDLGSHGQFSPEFIDGGIFPVIHP